MKQQAPLVRPRGPASLAGLVIVTAALGASSARADVPAWCKTEGVSKGRLQGDVQTALGTDATTATVAIVKATCFPDDEARQRAREVAKAKDRWSGKLSLGDAEWADLAVWASDGANDVRDFMTIYLPRDVKHAWSPLDPVQQFAAVMNGTDSDDLARATYFADALGTKLSETARLAYILRCLHTTVPTPKDVEWAMCAPDIARLDTAKLLAEVKAAKASASAKTKIRFAVYELPAKLAAHDTEVKALLAKDPAYGKLFDIAEATRKQWDGLWRTEADVLSLALAMEDGRQTGSRKAFEGCDDKTWEAWQREVSKLSGSLFESLPTKDDGITAFPTPAMAIVLSTPGGYNASVALYLCAQKGRKNSPPKDAIIASLGEVLSLYPGQRGPRTAAHLAIRNAGLVLDDQNARLRYPSSDLRGWFDGMGARGQLATVAKVEPGGTAPDGVTGPMVTVTFAKKLEKQEQCAAAKQLNRISYIHSDGSVTYQTLCTRWQTVTVNVTPSPAVVTAYSAKGLRPGMNAYVSYGQVMAAWTKKVKAPVLLAGAPLAK